MWAASSLKYSQGARRLQNLFLSSGTVFTSHNRRLCMADSRISAMHTPMLPSSLITDPHTHATPRAHAHAHLPARSEKKAWTNSSLPLLWTQPYSYCARREARVEALSRNGAKGRETPEACCQSRLSCIVRVEVHCTGIKLPTRRPRRIKNGRQIPPDRPPFPPIDPGGDGTNSNPTGTVGRFLPPVVIRTPMQTEIA